eukprot:scaffold32171_cov22-Prasinocladus_malaysianus.AAC.1
MITYTTARWLYADDYDPLRHERLNRFHRIFVAADVSPADGGLIYVTTLNTARAYNIIQPTGPPSYYIISRTSSRQVSSQERSLAKCLQQAAVTCRED